MSQLLDSYRRNAEAARIQAEQATLPNVKTQAAEAASRWLEMADRLQWVEEQGRAKSAFGTPQAAKR